MNTDRTKPIVAAALALITLAVYWQVSRFEFLNYDDTDYVTYNPMVQHGVTAGSLKWAFTTDHASNWHPLTWISHMLDCGAYGLKPGGHHLTNLLFHTANVVLLFLVLAQMTGAVWRSALVAALFAWHPLRVESVAWVSERKDVLSAFFLLLAIMAYGRYGRVGAPRRPDGPAGRPHPTEALFYILALVFFALGLMSKPMVVTLPFVLLLLDFWPLGRICDFQTGKRGPIAKLILEKVPFLILAAAASAATIWAQKAGKSVVSMAALPLSGRVANALVSYVLYLWKTVWPTDLAVLYPYSHHWTFLQTGGAVALLATITWLVVSRWRSSPYLVAGWFWFLGTLAPVIGIVQVGMQFMADRYTYIPLIGIYVAVVWSIPARWAVWPRPGLVFATAASAVLALCVMVTEVQLTYWRNSVSLFTHATEVTSGNILAEYNLGEALALKGDDADAVTHYLKALAIRPNPVEAQYNSQPQAHFNLGLIYRNHGMWTEAGTQFRAAIAAEPADPLPHRALADVLLASGHAGEAENQLRQSLQLNPDGVDALNQLAWLLATQPAAELRNGTEAVRLAEQARDLTHATNAQVLATLDAAYAEAGRFSEAIGAAKKTEEVASSQGRTNLVEEAAGRLKLYEAGRPVRQ